MSEAVRRWRSDEINRKVEQKKKILAEVQSSGRNVSTQTMKKYNIDYAEINVRREMGGYERLRMYQVPTTGVRTRSGRGGGDPEEGGGIATRPAGDFMRHNEEVDKNHRGFRETKIGDGRSCWRKSRRTSQINSRKTVSEPKQKN